MRKFNGERIQKLMNAMNMPEDEPITAGMVSSSIEGAQRKVEGHNFDIRKHLLEYDDVMNKQRLVIYGLRKEVLQGGDRLDQIILDMLSDVTGTLLDTFADVRTKPELWNLDGLSTAIAQQYGIQMGLMPGQIHSANELTELVKKEVKKAFDEQKVKLGPYVKQVEKMILLQTIDQRWKDHLQGIDQLRDWINLRAYAQKDPLVEYKQEAFKKFEEMNFAIKSEVIEKFLKIQLVQQGPGEQSQPPQEIMNPPEEYDEDDGDDVDESEPDDTELALQALKPKAKQRLVYSGGGDDGGGSGGGNSGMSRNDRRKLERDKKKKRF